MADMDVLHASMKRILVRCAWVIGNFNSRIVISIVVIDIQIRAFVEAVV